MYNKHGMRAYKQLVLNSLDLLLGEKIIKTNAPTTAHINLNYQASHESYILHLLHYIPERRCESLDVIEDIIPLFDIDVKVRLPKEPSKVYCAPSNNSLDFSYEGGYVCIKIPKILGHEMIVFE